MAGEMDAEGIDGVRMSWNVWPRSKVDGVRMSPGLLPEHALVGFVSFGTQVQVHELGFADLSKVYVFRGTKEITKVQILDQLGLSLSAQRGGRLGVSPPCQGMTPIDGVIQVQGDIPNAQTIEVVIEMESPTASQMVNTQSECSIYHHQPTVPKGWYCVVPY